MLIEIKALTEAGNKAIRVHYEESKKIPLAHRLVMKRLGFKQDIVEGTTYISLKLEVRNSQLMALMNVDDFKKKIVDALKDNGAVLDQDYFIVGL